MDALSKQVYGRGDTICESGIALGSIVVVPGLDHNPFFGPDIMDMNHHITILAKAKTIHTSARSAAGKMTTLVLPDGRSPTGRQLTRVVSSGGGPMVS